MAADLFRYEPLPVNQEVIRLLDVDLTGRNQHRLVPLAQIRTEKYLALSYTWGSSSQQLQIQLDGKAFSINPNLNAALQAVVGFWNTSYPDRNVLLIWIDQICINQGDEQEKNHQVAMMRMIYQFAHSVIVWLPVAQGCAHTFNTWSSWREWHQRQVRSSFSDNGQPLPSTENMAYSASRDMPVVYPGSSRHDQETNRILTAWDDVHTIINSPWWERAWIYQEFMGPLRATFLIDGIYAPWEELNEIFKLYFSHFQGHIDFCTKTLETAKVLESGACISCPACCDDCLQCCRSCTASCIDSADKHGHDWDSNFPSEWRCLGRCCKCYAWCLQQCDAGVASRARIRKAQRQAIKNHSQTLIDSAGAWKIANFIMESRSQLMKDQRSSAAYLPLIHLMGHARNCQASQAVDKVYAFLGLAEPGHAIGVDYSKPLTSLLTEVACAIIKKEQRLDILGIAKENTMTVATHGGQALPTWVPDWSVKDNANTSYRKFMRDIRYPTTGHDLGMDPVRASRNSAAQVAFHTNQYGQANAILQARGILADRLTQALANRPDQSFARFSGSSGIEIQTVSNAMVGDEVWILFGADDIFTLRRQGPSHILLGHAMYMERSPIFGDIMQGNLEARMREAQATTFVRDGFLMDKFARGEVQAQDVFIA